jgi:ketosteroid isomerase-like protein
MKKVLILVAILVMSFQCFGQKPSDTVQLKSMIEKYVQSINNAENALLADEIWEQSEKVAFIHPRGHEKGWETIKKNIYAFFRDTFSIRKLVSFDETYAVYKDTAIVDFYWIFDATFKKDNKPLQTKGRETQVWKKQGKKWRLVHVHYSGMPVTGEREGF